MTFLVAAHGLAGVERLTRRRQWYRLRYEGDVPIIDLREAAEFPRE